MDRKFKKPAFLALQATAGSLRIINRQCGAVCARFMMLLFFLSINAASASDLVSNFDLESSSISQPDFNNTASITQIGSNNKSIVTQSGTFNNSVNRQEGWENYIFVSQVGSDNYASVIQDGDRNTARIEQNGSNNSARIEQIGDDLTNSLVQNASNQFISVATFKTW